jgi:hypothetical protein
VKNLATKIDSTAIPSLTCDNSFVIPEISKNYGWSRLESEDPELLVVGVGEDAFMARYLHMEASGAYLPRLNRLRVVAFDSPVGPSRSFVWTNYGSDHPLAEAPLWVRETIRAHTPLGRFIVSHNAKDE